MATHTHTPDANDQKDSTFHCSECGKVLMAVPSGAVCPDGHGRIRAHITHSQIRRYAKQWEHWKWVKNLPELKPKNPDAKRPRVFWKGDVLVARTTVVIDGVKRRTARRAYGTIPGIEPARIGDRAVFVESRTT